jgi:hypothetical protein
MDHPSRARVTVESMLYAEQLMHQSEHSKAVKRWRDLGFGDDVVERQVAWERGQQVLRLRYSGLSYRDIGEILGVTRQRACQIAHKARCATAHPPVGWVNTPPSASEIYMMVGECNGPRCI